MIPERRSGIVKALQESQFTVITATADSWDVRLIKNSGRILCRLTGIEGFRAHAPLFDAMKSAGVRDMIMLTSDHDPDFYITAMGFSFTEFIVYPCSQAYLSLKMKEITGRSGDSADAAERPADSFTLALPGGGAITVHREGVLATLNSFIGNSIHQNTLLQGFLKHRPSFRGLTGDVDVIPAVESVFSDADIIEEELNWALEREEFVLFYQPVMSLKDNKVCGFEALIRWMHPKKGMLSPEQFIAQAEESPLIVPLGYWIVREAARQAVRWAGQMDGGPVRINVNLSARQFTDRDLARKIMEIAESEGIAPDSLGLEITESVFMEDMESANLNLLKLKAEGFSIYMDDFGTGYSSLSYLQHFPVDVIKIDKSFVQWMHIDEQSEVIVRSVIMLAHNLKHLVVAEGVEEEQHVEMLRRFGCDYIQGFHLSRPLCADEAIVFIKENCGR